jgi:hypothetical protein
MSTQNRDERAEGGRAAPRQGPPDIADADAPNSSGAGTDSAPGQSGEMARTGGEGAADSRASAPFEPATSSLGSRTGSVLGSQTGKTGMGDGEPTGSSQGLAIADRPDGGPVRSSK